MKRSFHDWGLSHRLSDINCRRNVIRRRHRKAPKTALGEIETLESRVLLAAYSVIDLGTLPGGTTTIGASLNNAGQVTGKSDFVDDQGEHGDHAFLWQDGKMTDIGAWMLRVSDSAGICVNATGDVVGSADVGYLRVPGFPAVFADGQVKSLDSLLPADSPWTFTGVSRINDDGTVLGWVMPAKTYPEGYTHLALFDTRSGELTDLGKVYPPDEGTSGLNNSGDAVVTDRDLNGIEHALVFSGGRATDLGSFSGGDTIAHDINDAGDVVGSSMLPATAEGARLSHPFLSHSGKLIDLGTGAFASGTAIAINNRGEIVGTLGSWEFDVDPQPFILRGGQMQLLDNLIPGDSAARLETVVDINDSGQILVNGWIEEGQYHTPVRHAFLLTPSASSDHDDTRPRATLDASDITTGGATTYTFTVHYTDDVAIAPRSIRADGVRVRSSRNFTASDLAVVSTVTDADGRGVMVTYQFSARGGVWNPADNGDYYIDISGGGVTDSSGNHISNHVGSPTPLGHFHVNLPSSTTEFAAATQSDMVVDANGMLHLAFYDAKDQVLKYATRSAAGVWSATSLIDANAGAGQFISIALDASGRPGVAYYAGGTADLKYAHFDGNAWTTVTVDSYHSTGGYPSLVFDAKGQAAIAYWRKASGDLRLARFDGTQWTIQTLDDVGNTGRFPSLKLDPTTHRLAVAWEDHDGGAFKYASENADGTFATTVVDDTTPQGGGYVSLAFSPQTGNPAFSYYDAAKGDLKLAAYDGAAWQDTHAGDKSTIGLYSRLSINQDGVATVYAYDRSGNALFRAMSLMSSLNLDAETMPIKGGRSINVLATGGAGDTTLAFLDSDLTHLHVEEYVGL